MSARCRSHMVGRTRLRPAVVELVPELSAIHFTRVHEGMLLPIADVIAHTALHADVAQVGLLLPMCRGNKKEYQHNETDEEVYMSVFIHFCRLFAYACMCAHYAQYKIECKVTTFFWNVQVFFEKNEFMEYFLLKYTGTLY